VRRRVPGALELVASRPANLVRREADLALRHEPPDSGDFYICKLGSFACAVYRRRGKNADAWVTYTESQANFEPARWVRQQVAGTQDAVALRASSMLMHLEAIVAGTGRGVLPCYVGDGHPLLERLTAPIAELAAEYWMVVHQVFADQRDVITGVVRDPVADQRPTRSTKGKRRDRTARPPPSRRAKDRPALRSQ
jgi:DNA-binding transcriptional LysR family regulator